VEGLTADEFSLGVLHKAEGKMLAKMMWRRKGGNEDWTAFHQRVYRQARLGLKEAGLPSLPQLFLYRQWCWAKDVCATMQRCSEPVPATDNAVFGMPVVPYAVSVFGDSPVRPLPEPQPQNKRQLTRECRERAQKRQRGPTQPCEPVVPTDVPLDDSYNNRAYKRLGQKMGRGCGASENPVTTCDDACGLALDG